MILLVVAAQLLCGCSRPPGGGWSTVSPNDTAKTNAVRETLKLRLIQPSWSFYGREFGTEKWSHNGRHTKIVHRPGHSIEWEQDYYYSGAKYIDPFSGNTDEERVIVSYDYDQKQFYVRYIGQNSAHRAICERGFVHGKYGMTASVEVVFAAADQILETWGQSRR
jgi:hypothetical protein